MSKEIEELKYKLRQAYKKEMNDNTVRITLTLNAYGFVTEIDERESESLKLEGVSTRNLKGEWIK